MKRILSMTLALILVLMIVPSAADAATSLPNDLYLQQETDYTCPLSSSAMMLRARMYLSGYDNWRAITETAIKPYAWVTAGLLSSWSYSIDGNTMNVSREFVSGFSVSTLKAILNKHPEGIVLHANSVPHAVLVTDYENDTFYCADPAAGYSRKRMTLASSWLGYNLGNQTAILNATTSYWYISSYSVVGEHTCNKGQFLYYWKEHPHYNGYRCSICGAEWADTTETNYVSTCDTCNPPVKYENLGADFYAHIQHPASGFGLCNVKRNVELGEYSTTGSLWRFIRQSDNSYQIISNVDGNALDVQDNATEDGTNVQVYGPNGTTAQKWYIKSVGDGYSLISASSLKALDIADGSTDFGANAWIYSQNESTAQIFRITPVSETPGFTLSTNRITLDVDGVNSQTIMVTQYGTFTGWSTITCYSDSLNCSWGAWNGPNIPLTVTAWNTDDTQLEIELYYSDTGVTIDTASLVPEITSNSSSYSYSVYYHAEGGTGAPATEIKYHGVPFTLSETVPTRKGYHFLGWSLYSAACTVEYEPGDILRKNATTSLYAVWQKDDADEHSYIYGVGRAPTSTESGYLEAVCYECNYDTIETIPELNTEDYTYTVKIPATCVTNGSAVYTYKLPADRTVYFDNSIYQWEQVYVYTWSASGEHSGSWPGVPMSLIAYNRYAYKVPTDAEYMIFNNGNNGAQTQDLNIPTDGKNLYNGNDWSEDDRYRRFDFAVALPAIGHQYSFTVTKKPTATQEGEAIGVCTRCSGSITMDLPELDEGDYSTDIAVPQNCQRNGVKCYSWYTDIGEIAFNIELEKIDHRYGEGKVTSAASCTEAGVQTFTCNWCEHTYTQSIAPKGHSYRQGVCTACGGKDPNYTTLNGLHKVNGVWYYYRNGVIATDITSLIKYNGEWWYVVKGRLASEVTDLIKYNGEWFYVVKGKVASATTDLIKYNGEWFYVVKGKVASNTTTLVQYNGGWYYIYKGKLAAKTTTLVKYSGSWYYVKNGKVDFTYSGRFLFNGSYYTVKSGRVA